MMTEKNEREFSGEERIMYLLCKSPMPVTDCITSTIHREIQLARRRGAGSLCQIFVESTCYLLMCKELQAVQGYVPVDSNGIVVLGNYRIRPFVASRASIPLNVHASYVVVTFDSDPSNSYGI